MWKRSLFYFLFLFLFFYIICNLWSQQNLGKGVIVSLPKVVMKLDSQKKKSCYETRGNVDFYDSIIFLVINRIPANVIPSR